MIPLLCAVDLKGTVARDGLFFLSNITKDRAKFRAIFVFNRNPLLRREPIFVEDNQINVCEEEPRVFLDLDNTPIDVTLIVPLRVRDCLFKFL